MVSPQIEPSDSAFREAHLRDYWKIVWQARWTVLAIFVVVVGIAAVWSFMQTPLYRATATLEVQPQANRVAVGQDVSGMGAAGYGWFAEEKYHNTQIEIIKSRNVSRRVVRMLGLDSHPRFLDAADPADRFRKFVRVEPRRDTGLLEVRQLTGRLLGTGQNGTRDDQERGHRNASGHVTTPLSRSQGKSLTPRPSSGPPTQHHATFVPSPHISPDFVARAARCRAQRGFRPEGRGGVLDRTSSTPRRENTAGCGASPAAVDSW